MNKVKVLIDLFTRKLILQEHLGYDTGSDPDLICQGGSSDRCPINNYYKKVHNIEEPFTKESLKFALCDVDHSDCWRVSKFLLMNDFKFSDKMADKYLYTCEGHSCIGACVNMQLLNKLKKRIFHTRETKI